MFAYPFLDQWLEPPTTVKVPRAANRVQESQHQRRQVVPIERMLVQGPGGSRVLATSPYQRSGCSSREVATPTRTTDTRRPVGWSCYGGAIFAEVSPGFHSLGEK